MPDDDIALLNQLRRDGEITEEQYETLRRHVLWGAPLPELLEETLGGEDSEPGAPDEVTVQMPDPGHTAVPPDDGRTVILSKPPANVPTRRPTDPQQPRRFTPTLPSSPTPPAGNQPRVNPPPTNQPPAGNQPPTFRPRTGSVPPPAQRPVRPPYSGPPQPPAQRPAPPSAQRPAPPAAQRPIQQPPAQQPIQ